MKINKLFASGLSVLLISLLCSGCASKKKNKDVGVSVAEPAVQNEVSAQKDSLNNGEMILSALSPIEDDDFVEPQKKNKKKSKTGWVDNVSSINTVFGDVKLSARPKKGTFLISVINDEEKAVPVLSTSNEYTTTSFYLHAGKKIIKLCDDSSVKTAVKKTDSGLKIRYTIEKVGTVVVDFTCFSSEKNKPADSIRITAAVESKNRKDADFSVKLLMDTILGETDRHHFYFANGSAVKNEVVYHTMKDEKWFTSKNAKANLQIILDGLNATPVDTVALANFTTLDTRKWDADLSVSRTFDTVLSYNNSAVGIYWPKHEISENERFEEVFYLSLASDGRTPKGVDYVFAEKSSSEEDAVSANSEDKNIEIPAVTEIVENIPVAQEPVKTEVLEITKNEVPAPVNQFTEPEDNYLPAQNALSNESSEEIYSPEYIESLLLRIEQLEELDDNVSREEIFELNAQIDKILKELNN